MKHVWHYINEGDFPSTDCVCLCRVKGYINYYYTIANYFAFKVGGDWCSAGSGDLISDTITCWADLNEVLRCIKEVEDET